MYTEREILAEAIAVIDEYGSVMTAELISLLRERMQPEGEDLEMLKNRNDDKFSQKVRNLVSHKSLEKYSILVKDENGRNVFYSKDIVKSEIDVSNKDVQNKIKVRKHTARRFAARFVDYTKMQIENQELGDLGEIFVYNLEVKRTGEEDEVEHTSKVRGDGTGYDISVFKQDGTYKYIEVKTTKGEKGNSFYMSINEYDFYKMHINNYELARVYYFDKEKKTGQVDYYSGADLEVYFEFEVNAYKIRLIE